MREVPNQKWFRAVGFPVFAVVVLNACGGGGSGGGDPVPPRTLTTISISPSDLTLEALGATSQLEATARDQNGNTMPAQFSWSASDNTVVTVDADGLVTASANGSATVTVSSGSVSASATVTVEQRPASIALSPDGVVLTALGAYQPMEASVFDANDRAMAAEVAWASSDAAVASVDGDGAITAHANGTTTVTATTGSVSASVTVTVQQAVSSIDLAPETVTLAAIDQLAQLAATALDANGHPVDTDIAYTSSEPTVAEIDETGVVIARRNGSSTITARSGAVSATAAVTVMQVLDRVTVVPDDMMFSAIGESARVQVLALDANGYPMNLAVSLSSSEPAVASVDSTGLVTAQANGTATVTATIGMLSDSVAVTVEQQVAGVSVAPPDTPTLDAIGATVQLQATAHDANGHTVNVEFEWASSDPAIATVDATGLVTAQANGTVTVTATAGTLSDSVAVTVNQQVASVSVAPPDTPTLDAIGATVQLQATAQDANGHTVSVEFDWASSHPAIATVDENGLVTARSNGTATVTATVGSITGSVAVTVQQPTPITVSVTCTPLEVNALEASQCTVSVEGTGVAPQWTASGGTIDPTTGLFTAPDTAATFTVTATVRDQGRIVSGSAEVTVRERPPIAVSVTCTPLQVYSNDSSRCTATVEGTSALPEWEASGGTIDRASGNFISPNSPGTVTITATVRDQNRIASGSIEIIVRERPPVVLRLDCTPRKLHPSETSQCTVSVEGTDDTPRWSVSSGTIDPTTGIFTAPDSPATVEISVGVNQGPRKYFASLIKVTVWPREPVRERAFVDLPDDEAGYQAHILYVLASDAEDREFDTNSAIDRSVDSWNEWLAEQTGGRRLRLDRVDGAIDVTFVRLDQTAEELARGLEASRLVATVQTELIIKGFAEPNKIYLAYYDSGILPYASAGGHVCGHANTAVAVLYTRECGFPQDLNLLDVPDFVGIHELVHVLGFVPECAPHQGHGSHVADSATDLMAPVIYGFMDEIVLDANRDDYFEAGVAGCRDLADSAFLDPLPAAADVPSWLQFETLESIGCDREGSLRATPQEDDGRILVFNGTAAPLNIYWLDASGTRDFQNNVRPYDWESHHGGGLIVVTDETNQCLGIYGAPMNGGVGRVIIK